MSLTTIVQEAVNSRKELVKALGEEGTDCWRLFHGVAEGKPGLTIDRYGKLVLVQTFREPLAEEEIEELQVQFSGLHLVYNHRGGGRKRLFALHRPSEEALEPHLTRELNLKYEIQARHRGIDPHLFLDLRAGRRWLKGEAQDKSVLNLFAYSCGLGQVAVSGGASEVWNVDFSESALEVGRSNLGLNGLSQDPVRFLKEDFFPVIWQLSGVGVKGRRARRKFKKVEPRQFDIVCLDPPAKAKGPFHTVDLVNDYQSLFKPCLLVCKPGGTLLVTNNVGSVSRDTFEQTLVRCAEKAGRPIQDLSWLTPDSDFPSFDGQHPLKIALMTV